MIFHSWGSSISFDLRYELFCIRKHQAFVQVSVAKMNFCCGKLKENKKDSLAEVVLWDNVWRTIKRRKQLCSWMWRLQANHIEHSSTEHTTFFSGGTTPPPNPSFGNSMKKNQSLLHLEGFLNIPLPFGKVDYSVTKIEEHSVGNTGAGDKLTLVF